MNDYMGLIGRVWRMNRVHVSDDMQSSLEKTADFYKGSSLLTYSTDSCVGAKQSWQLPKKWTVKKATLETLDGDIICDFNKSLLHLWSYSSSFSGIVSKDELKKHLFTNPSKPDVIPFYFRLQYRPWEESWGFSLSHSQFEELEEEKYRVNIDTVFSNSELTQLEYEKKGRVSTRYLFLSHFDHPAMCNDGLCGCIAANEVIRRLQGRDTYYSYASLNTVEIVGSVAYCEYEKKKIADTKEALVIAMPASDTPIAYQYSTSPDKSTIDRVMRLFMQHRYPENKVGKFREIVGNDEIAFEAVGIDIRCSSVSRFPYGEYHTSLDDFDHVNEDKIEEVVDLVLDLVEVLENNYLVEPVYEGLPCLGHPDYDLYLSRTIFSGVENNSQIGDQYLKGLKEQDIDYIKSNLHLLNKFTLLVTTGGLITSRVDVLKCAEISSLPFFFVLNYFMKMEEKKLVKLVRVH